MTTIELALFKLKPQVNEADFIASLAATNAWLARQPGFILRRHGRAESGERIDYLEWESLAHARAATAAFAGAPETRAFMDAIDPASLSLRHFEAAP